MGLSKQHHQNKKVAVTEAEAVTELPAVAESVPAAGPKPSPLGLSPNISHGSHMVVGTSVSAFCARQYFFKYNKFNYGAQAGQFLTHNHTKKPLVGCLMLGGIVYASLAGAHMAVTNGKLF